MLGKEEADFIARELAKIGTKPGSEAEKLGLMRRLILQGVAGYSSSLGGRLGAAGFNFAEQIPTSSGMMGGPIAPPPQKREGLFAN